MTSTYVWQQTDDSSGYALSPCFYLLLTAEMEVRKKRG